MAIPEFLTLKTAGMAGAGVAGISGVAVLLNTGGGGGSKEGTISTDVSDVVLGSSSKSKSKLDKSNAFEHSRQDYWGTYACFKKFFPGSSEVKRQSLSQGQEPAASDTAPRLTISSPSSSGNSGDVLGCSMATMVGKADKFAFETELTFRNDKYGWALWSVGKYEKEKSKATFNNTVIPPNYVFYQVVFLKNGAEGWSVEGGYKWYDLEFLKVSKVNENNEVDLKDKFHFMIPGSGNGDDWVTSLTTSDQTKEHWGIWTTDSSSKDEGLLQGLSIWAGTSEKPEILGRKPVVDFNKDKQSYGYSQVLEVYLNSNTGFTKYPITQGKINFSQIDGFMIGYHKFDISSTLDAWFYPFKSQRGKWKALSDYCNDSSQIGEFKKLCPANASSDKE